MKPEISHQIVKKIRERGGGFLRRGSDGMYCDIGEYTAKEKTSQALRHRSFDLHNLLDPNRVKRNGRWIKNKEHNKTENGNNVFPSTASAVPPAISKEGSPSPSFQPHPEDTNNAIAQQSIQGQCDEGKSDAASHIPHTESPYHHYIEGLASLRQHEEQMRWLHSFDLLRLYQQNYPSFGLHNNSFAHSSDILLNPAMQSIQPMQPIHVSLSIFQGDSNMVNNRPPFPINNTENLTNEMVERLIHLHNARTQASSSPSSPFNM